MYERHPTLSNFPEHRSSHTEEQRHYVLDEAHQAEEQDYEGNRCSNQQEGLLDCFCGFVENGTKISEKYPEAG